MLHLLSIALQLAVASPALDSARLAHKTTKSPRMVTAVRTKHPPSIDGKIDDTEWAAAPLNTGLTMQTPREGEPSSERSEFRILYDNQSIYVAARMFERDPSNIRSFLTRRDAADEKDFIAVFFDSYHDHQTAFGFAVNPDGVRLDGIGADDDGPNELSWDPVWEATTTRDAGGWTAEMRIPLSQLRFPGAREQLWGFQFYRKLSGRNEEDFFEPWKNAENGYASRFAHLIGISDIPSSRRLEAIPYARGQVSSHRAEKGDPFFDGMETMPAFGLDVKYGVTSNLTLDATINPDFGQVEADPAELNLGVFETFQQERRPFFLEGAQIFDFRSGCRDFCFGNTPQYFYSRRIGRAPELSPSEDRLSNDSIVSGPFYDVPTSTPILGAAKLSGKLGNGMSLGLLQAETGEAFGRVFARGVPSTSTLPRAVQYRDALEPRAHYSVARVRRDLRDGATTIGLLMTNVQRQLSTDQLEATFNSGATSLAADVQHKWMQNRFNFNAHAGVSYIRGSRSAISDAQTSSARYFQRRDQSYVMLDTNRTSLTGSSAHAALRYNGPTGLIVGATIEQVSPGFEVNDFGFLASADNRALTARLGWSRPKPGKHVRYHGVDLVGNRMWNYGRVPLQTIAGLGSFIGLQSGWSGSAFLFYGFEGLDQTATRGGPLTRDLAGPQLNFNLNSDSRRKIFGELSGFYQTNTQGRRQGNIGSYFSIKPMTNLQLSLGPRYSANNRFSTYVRRETDEAYATETYGRRYVFAELWQRSMSVTTRASYTFSPSLSLQLYLEPFTSSADYFHFKELRRPRSADYVEYGEDNASTITAVNDPDACDNPDVPSGRVRCYTVDPDGPGPASAFTFANPDRSFRSLRGTSVLRWEYRPGATFFAVWTQNRSASLSAAEYGGVNDIGGLFGLPLENVFLVKINYWFSP